MYDVYRGTTDRMLRLATMPGAGLPADLKRKDWVLLPAGKFRFIGIRRVISAFATIAPSKASKANDDMIADYAGPAQELTLRQV